MAEKRVGKVSLGGEADERAALLKHDIERTRNEIEDTVAALETRLSPARIKQQISTVKEHAVEQFHDAKEQVKSELKRDVMEAKLKVKDEIGEARAAVREATVGKVEHMVHRASDRVRYAGGSVVENVRANPLPFALIGAGVAWLLMSNRSSIGVRRLGGRYEEHDRYDANYDRYDRARYYDEEYGRPDLGGERIGARVGEVRRAAGDFVNDAKEKTANMVGDVREKASHVVDDVRDKASHVAHDYRDRASHLAHEARDRAMHLADEGRMRARQVGDRAEHMLDDNPLAVGAVAFAVGAAIGLALPTSQAEDRLFGEAKERLMSKAEEAARTALHQAEERATNAMHGGERDISGEREEGRMNPENRPNGVI